MEDTKANIESNTNGKATVIAFHSIGASPDLGPAATNGDLMETEVIDAFAKAQTLGTIEFVVQNLGPNMPPPDGPDMRKMSSGFMKYMWDINFLISFLVGREAARIMVRDDGQPCGTLLFTGATGSMRGSPPFVAYAQAKAGVRFLAQSMGREFGPKGLHVGHVIIDALIDGARVRNLFGGREKFDKRKGKWGGLGIEWAAESFYQLHL